MNEWKSKWARRMLPPRDIVFAQRAETDEEQARKILGDAVKPDGGIIDCGAYLRFSVADVLIDGHLGADELEAIIWWMRNRTVKASRQSLETPSQTQAE